jgi:hypothetical protein
MSLGSNNTAGPPAFAAATAAGNADTMSAGVMIRRQNTDACENNASAFSEPLRPLVS